MWADYYEKYKGTPKFGMSEQDKLQAQAKLEGLKNALQTNMLMNKMQQMKDIQEGKNVTAEDIAGLKQGAERKEGGGFTAAAPTDVAPLVAATAAQKTSQGEVNTQKAAQLGTITSALKDALAPSADGSKPKMVTAGINAGPLSLKNPQWEGQKAVIGQEAKQFGTQAGKTYGALHGVMLMNSLYHPDTDTYDLSKMPAEELSQLATTVISNSNKGDAKTRDEMRVKSLQGMGAEGLGWVLGEPINQVSGKNARLLEDIMFRQGSGSSSLKKTSAESLGSPDVGADFDTEAGKYQVYQNWKKRQAGGGKGSQVNQKVSIAEKYGLPS